MDSFITLAPFMKYYFLILYYDNVCFGKINRVKKVLRK
nr:MAG TPA: hypothetical protein [Caudoviricetes sp.]